MIPVAILAGGLATRLGPRTARLPKSLIEVAGKPFVSHQLSLLRSQGIANVVLCIGHFGEVLADFVGDGSRFGLEVAYSSDKDKLLGTGGAIQRALPLLGERFFVLYGDSYLEGDFHAVQSAHAQSGKRGLMTVLRNDNAWDGSNVVFREGRIERYDKTEPSREMHHIDWGLGVFDRSAFADAPQGVAFDLASVYQRLLEHDQLAGYEVTQRFYEIGSPDGISDLETYLLSRGGGA